MYGFVWLARSVLMRCCRFTMEALVWCEGLRGGLIDVVFGGDG